MHVWIVEMLDKKKWKPTIGCGLTKADAVMRIRAEWQRGCPDDKFRPRKYVPDEQQDKR